MEALLDKQLLAWVAIIKFGDSALQKSHPNLFAKLLIFKHPILDPIAVGKAKIVYNFGLSECNREATWPFLFSPSFQMGLNHKS